MSAGALRMPDNPPGPLGAARPARAAITLSCICALAALAGCSRGSSCAVVIDNVVASRSPRIRNDRCFAVLTVDGGAFRREPMIPLTDMYPGVLVGPGVHRFKVKVKPLAQPPGFSPPKEPPYETTFAGAVLAGHRYLIASENGVPRLVDMN